MMEREEKANLWLQATPERQQPTANERLLAASKSKSATRGRETLRHTNERLLMMEIEEKASLWLQAREATPERQQPTTNERLLAARVRAPHEAERH